MTDRMKIERGKTYVCLKTLHSNVGPDHMAFTEGSEYTADHDNALCGDDNLSYALPAHWRLADWFKLKED